MGFILFEVIWPEGSCGSFVVENHEGTTEVNDTIKVSAEDIGLVRSSAVVED